MQNREISRQIQRLLALVARTNEVSAGDLEIQAHWAKYLCVLSAGLLENALTEVYVEYANRAANEAVTAYVRSSLSKILNPKTSKYVETATAFNKTWGIELDLFANEEGRKEAINAIMINRHKIAHGKTSDIFMARVKEYLQKSIELIEFVEEQCKR